MRVCKIKKKKYEIIAGIKSNTSEKAKPHEMAEYENRSTCKESVSLKTSGTNRIHRLG